jgi:radical SAM superfamily enzyme YgiQ (UPF0313 family)
MKALLVYVPSRKGLGANCLPMGPMAAANIFSGEGHEARIFDLLYGGIDSLMEMVGEYKPDIVGYSGIASSYPMAKEVSASIRAKYGDIVHLAGGPLASTYDLMLENRIADYVVHGEAEVSLPRLLNFLKGCERIEDIGGISYVGGGKVVRNAPERQVEDLDVVKLPAYHLVDMDRYFGNLNNMTAVYGYSITMHKELAENLNGFIQTGRDRFIEIVTSRGCTHACLFCYRHVRGVRRHSVGYTIKHIRHLVDEYGIGGVAIADELFNSDNDWVYDFCDAVESEFRGDFFYRILGARVPQINGDILRRLRDTGCIEINFGHESGSPRILKDYRKGATVQQNIEATVLANKIGIFTPVQLVIGSPAETTETIRETMGFLRAVNTFYHSTSVNYIIPLPETPIWRHIQEHKLIPDTGVYLERVASFGGMHSLGLNLTRASDFVWKFWLVMIYRVVGMNEARAQRKYLRYIVEFLYIGVFYKFLSKKFPTVSGFFNRLFSHVRQPQKTANKSK